MRKQATQKEAKRRTQKGSEKFDDPYEKASDPYEKAGDPYEKAGDPYEKAGDPKGRAIFLFSYLPM